MPGSSYEKFQDALLALACDAERLADFDRLGVSSLARFELDERAERALLAIPMVSLRRYRESLLAKRADEFARAVPLSRRVCPSIVARYERWLSRHPAPLIDSVLGPGEREALRALEPLRVEIAHSPEETRYAADLFAHEVLRACSRRDHVRRCLRTRFDLPAILGDLERGLLPTDPPESPFELSYEGERVLFRRMAA